MRVAIVARIAPKKLGSFEDWMIELGRDLRARGHQVDVCIMGVPHPVFQERLISHNITLARLDGCVRSIPRALGFLWNKYDVVHLSLFAPREPFAIAAYLVPRSKVIFQDCFSTPILDPSSRQSMISRVLDRITFSTTHTLSAVSEFVAARDQTRFGLPDRKIAVVYNGVSPTRFAPGADDSSAHDILCVASLTVEKGVHILLRAMALLGDLAPTLGIAGDGPERHRLEALVLELGLERQVRFVGLVDNVDELMRSCAVVVHPAIWGEAFGLTIAEAMASGRAIVVSRVGATPELISDRVNGRLFESGDFVALASTLRELLLDSSVRSRLGIQARSDCISRFSLHDWVVKSRNLIETGS